MRSRALNRYLWSLLTALFVGTTSVLAAQDVPEWLWTNKDPQETETVYLRRTFDLPAAPKSATFFGSCDNVMTLFVNGQRVTQHSAWESPARENLTKRLQAGKNVIAVRAANQGSAAGFIAQFDPLLHREKRLLSKS